MSGCLLGCAEFAVAPSDVTPIPPERDFEHLTCPQLEAEAIRLTETYEQLQGSTKPNIRNRYSRLNGEAYAVNDSIRVNGCKLAAVQIPSFYNHHKYPGSPE